MSAYLDGAKARLISQRAALDSTRKSLAEARKNKWPLAERHLVSVEKRQASAVAYTEGLVAEAVKA